MPSSRSCIAFIISSLVLHQLSQTLGDRWTDDDKKIKCLIIASIDEQEHDEVNEECYKIYDSPSSETETEYYDIKNVRLTMSGEFLNEGLLTSVYERLKIVARKRRDFLVELISKNPSRSVLYTED